MSWMTSPSTSTAISDEDDLAPISLIDLDAEPDADDDVDADELAPLSLAELDGAEVGDARESAGQRGVDVEDDAEPEDPLDDLGQAEYVAIGEGSEEDAPGEVSSLPSGDGWDNAVLAESYAAEDEDEVAAGADVSGGAGEPAEFVRMTAELPEPRNLGDPGEGGPEVGGPGWQPGGRESARRRKRKKREARLAPLAGPAAGGAGRGSRGVCLPRRDPRSDHRVARQGHPHHRRPRRAARR